MIINRKIKKVVTTHSFKWIYCNYRCFYIKKYSLSDVGIFLFSRAVASQVSSALQGLTSVFGMGTGGPPASSTPTVDSEYSFGSPSWTRTNDPAVNSRMLYRLSYWGIYLLHNHRCSCRSGDSCGNRTRVAGVRGRSLNRLTNEPFESRGSLLSPSLVLVHHQGLEPGTPWLRVRCSTNWANGAYKGKHPENWTKCADKGESKRIDQRK